jgi:hypothetical protein
LRESAKHAAAFALQSEHIKQLHRTVETGNAALLGHITNLNLLVPAASTQTQQTSMMRAGTAETKRQKRNKSYRLRVSLPRWFMNCVWELGVHEADGVWTTQIWTVNVRPYQAVVFDYVRSGDVEAVRELLQSGQLSMRDHEHYGSRSRSLFEVSTSHSEPWPSKLTVCRWQPQKEDLSCADFCYKRALCSIETIS